MSAAEIEVPKSVIEAHPQTHPDNWRPHASGVWVHDSAYVHPTAHLSGGSSIGENTFVHRGAAVGIDSVVGAGCHINEFASIGAHCRIANRARVGRDANVHHSSEIGAGVELGHGAVVGARTEIGAGCGLGRGAYIGDDCTISGRVDIAAFGRISAGSVVVTQPLFILGSEYTLSESAPGELSIGCQVRSLATWIEEGPEIARCNGMAGFRADEYMAYIRMYAALLAIRQPSMMPFVVAGK